MVRVQPSGLVGNDYDVLFGTQYNPAPIQSIPSVSQQLGIYDNGSMCLTGFPTIDYSLVTQPQMSVSPNEQNNSSPVVRPQPQPSQTNQQVGVDVGTDSSTTDPCSNLQPPTTTVEMTVGNVDNIVPGQLDIVVDTMMYYACEVLKGSSFSSEYRDFNDLRVLEDGHHRFVAYRHLGSFVPSLINLGQGFWGGISWGEVVWDKNTRDPRWQGNRNYSLVP
ncbi:MAG: hypothetical protein AAFY41_11460 [Bacteroidota bacterium]